MAKIKAPKVKQGTVGKLKRFATSSRKKPNPTGLSPSSPGYGIMPSGGISDPIGRANRNTGSTSGRNLPSGQGNLTSKAKRWVC